MPATQWYKVCPCRIKGHEIADPCGGCLYMYPGDPRADGRSLHSGWAKPGSNCGGLWGSTPAMQPYKGHLGRIKAQDIANPCWGSLDRYPCALKSQCQIPPQPQGQSRI